MDESLLPKHHKRKASTTKAYAAIDLNHSGDEREESETRVTLDDVDNEEANSTFTVSQAISEMGFGWMQWKLLIICGIVWASDALEVMLLSFLLPEVTRDWNLEPAWEATIGGIVFTGMLLGSPSWGLISDKYGRKIGFYSSLAVSAIFGILSGLAPSLPYLLIARALVGFGLSGSPVAFSLFAEFLPLKNRGVSLTMIEAFWTVGTVIEAGIAWIVLPIWGWRALVIISSIPLLAALLTYPIMPESPRFLMEQGNKAKALSVLKDVASSNKKSLPQGELVMPKEEGRDGGYLFLELFNKNYRRTTTVVWTIWFMNSFCYYGLVLLTPTYFEVREEASSLESGGGSVFLNVLITSAAEFPGLIINALLVDRFGRKKTQSLFFFIAGLSSFLLILKVPVALSTFFAVLARLSIAAAFATTYLVTPEVYPTFMRTTAVGTASAFARIAGMITPFVVTFFTNSSELYIPLVIYGLCCFFGCFAAFLLPAETSKQEMK